MIHDTDYDRGDWEHEVKRDKALDRIAELEAQVAALTKDNDDIHELAEHYRVENGRLRWALIPLLADYEEARAEWNSPDTETYAEHLIEEARAALEQSNA